MMSNPTLCVGIYGGTFNPVHLAHQALAACCLDALPLDRLHVMPSRMPDYKAEPVDATLRLQMLELVFNNNAKITIDTRELERDGYTYTIDTVRDFRAQFGNEASIVFVMGADSWRSFHTWQEWDSILQLVHIVILNRPGYNISQYEDSSESKRLQIEFEQRYQKTTDALKNTPSGSIVCLDMPLMNISSTEIRRRINHQDSTQTLLDPKVRDFIDAHGLYRSSKTQPKTINQLTNIK